MELFKQNVTALSLLGETVQFLIVEGTLWNIVLNFIGRVGGVCVKKEIYS